MPTDLFIYAKRASMSDHLKLWGFILLLPFLAALGFDLYTNLYKNEENKAKIENLQIDSVLMDKEAYHASDFGYLLVHYTPTIYEKARASVQEDTWRRWVDPILELYTTVVAAVPAVIFFLWVAVSRIFRDWPFIGKATRARHTGDSKKKADEPFNKRDVENTFRYKRK